MTTLHDNEVCVVFAEHTRVVVFFVEVDEHENMSVLLVTHDVIIDFDELFWTNFTSISLAIRFNSSLFLVLHNAICVAFPLTALGKPPPVAV